MSGVDTGERGASWEGRKLGVGMFWVFDSRWGVRWEGWGVVDDRLQVAAMTTPGRTSPPMSNPLLHYPGLPQKMETGLWRN